MENRDPIEVMMSMDDYLPLRDVVFQTLRSMILTGELKPGERLMEIHLSKRMGVSRTPIREAIRKLELEGLVIMIPRKGAHVASITVEHVQQVLEVRRALETLTVALACERISVEGQKNIREAEDAFEKATETGDAQKIAQADVVFHNVILRETRNERLIALLNNLSEQMYRFRFEYIKDIDSYSSLIQEHEMLYEAIVQQNIEKAVEIIRIHIDNQAVGIYKVISQV